jgi:voltage-gated potassium channel|tara:strand:+ start:4571 stop:5344 length:774 start_codon:yes stop_codon:yes gene_type:complete
MAHAWVSKLRELYEGDSDAAYRFRYGLLYFDIGTILYVVATSFTAHGGIVPAIDVVIGFFILIDFCARLAISEQKMRFLVNPISLADILAIASFLISIAGGSAGFLRVLRTLRLLHTYQLLDRLRADVPFFRQKEELLIASVNLAVFLFVMTGLIYATQHRTNPEISNYVDALYFTVTTLTTTGYGDVLLEGTSGRMISVGVMIIGVTLFLRLAQVIFRPRKVREPCRICGLTLHDPDAVHCKHCGTTIHITTEGTY